MELHRPPASDKIVAVIFAGPLTAKLAGYFRLTTVIHYLIVDPDQPLIIHHARSNADSILTRIVREGMLVLGPPGLDLALADVYGGA